MKKKLIEKHKKEIIIATLITIAVLVGVIGTTYAMFIAKGESDVQEMYKVGDLSVAFQNTDSTINMRDEYPMTDEAGLKTTPHTFTITNNGDYNVTYTIQIENKKTGLNPTHIKYAINASTPTLLSTETSSIDIGTLTPKEKKTFELRLWVDEKTDETQANKTYEGQIKVNGQAVRIPYFKDTSGANSPEIDGTGLIPVVYDGVNDEWMVADQEKGWYAYQDQVWANAVTVSDTAIEYRSAKAGTVIPMDAINSMWVWIPRYKYQIPSDVGSADNVTNPPQIDVVFEKNTETTGLYNDIGASGYYTHPAFRDGNTQTLTTSSQEGAKTGWNSELTGIWIGKFETGGTTSIPLIKPDIQSLTNQKVSNLFNTSLVFAGGEMATDGKVKFTGNATYGLTDSTTDTHMMKNTEWGAVAYLSQSKYGKNGNSNYTTTNKEIYINNSKSYYTGRSGGTPNQSGTTNGTYSYNGKSCDTVDDTTNECTVSKTEESITKGTGASTTGTIYGIYDTNGGAWEYVMGNLAGKPSQSGFTTFPEQKYWDQYIVSSSDSPTKEKSIKGDATYETMRWFSNYPIFPISSYPWYSRGGYSVRVDTAQTFSYNYGSGSSASDSGFRSVLIP